MPIHDVLNQYTVEASLQFAQYPRPNLPADCPVSQATAQLRGTGRYDANRPAYKYLLKKGLIWTLLLLLFYVNH